MALLALPLLHVGIVLALAPLLYVLLFVGRRGRNFPDGKSNLNWNPQVSAADVVRYQARPHYQ